MYIFTVHPEFINMPEPYQSREIYNLAFGQIAQNPSLLLRGVLHNWSTFLFNDEYGVFSYVSGENAIINFVLRWSIYVLSILGILRWVSKPSDKFSSLVMVAALGVFVSVPFVPPTDASHLRLYAASILILALLPAMGLVYILERLPSRIALWSKPDTGSVSDPTVVWFSFGLIAVMIIAPAIVKHTGNAPQLPPTVCEAGTDSIVTRFDEGTYFRVVPDSDPASDGMPVFHFGVYRRNSHGLTGQTFMDWALKAKPPFIVFDTLDYRTYGEALIRMPGSLLPRFSGLMELCGEWEPDRRLYHSFHTSSSIFYAKSIYVLSR
jgi:hypothetical protein